MTPLAPTPVLPAAAAAAAAAAAVANVRPQVSAPSDANAERPNYDAVQKNVAAATQSPKPRPASPTPSSTVVARSAFDALGQILAAVLPKPVEASAPEKTPEPVSAPATAALPDPMVAALLATLPQLPVLSASPLLADTPVLTTASTATIEAATASLFFQDEGTSTTDAADFAEDLIAALTSASTVPMTADTKSLAKVDMPLAADPLPKLDLTSDAWLDQLTKDIAATATSDGKLSFRIVPPQLGKLDIAIETRDAAVAVHMRAETREAHAIIATAQARLEDALGAQGIRVAETSVTSNGGEDLPRPHFVPQTPLIEAVTETKREGDAPTSGRGAGRFA